MTQSLVDPEHCSVNSCNNLSTAQSLFATTTFVHNEFCTLLKMKKMHRVGVTNPGHVMPKQGASSGAARGLKGAPRVILVSENANLCRRQHQSVVQGDFTLERKSCENPGWLKYISG